MADAVARLILDASGIQQNLMRELGLTQREAAKAALKLAQDQAKAAEKAAVSHEAAGKRIRGAYAGASAAATDAGRAANGAASGFKAAETSISRGKEAVAQLGSALSVLDPTVGRVVMQTSALAGAGKAGAVALTGLGAAAVPLALGLAAVAAATAVATNAWSAATEETRQLDRSLAEVQRGLDPKAIDTSGEAWGRYLGHVEDLNSELGILSGALSSYDVAAKKRGDMIRQEAQGRILATAATWAQLDAERALLQTQIDSGRLNLREEEAVRTRLVALREEVPAARQRLEALKADVALEAERAELLEWGQGAAKEAEATERRRADAARKHREEQERIAREMERQARLQAEAAARLGDMGRAAVMDLLTPEAQITYELERQLAIVDELAAKAGDLGDASATRLALEGEAARKIEELRARERAQAQADADARIQDELRVQSAKIQLATATTDAVIALGSMLLGANRDQNLALFYLERAAALSQIGLNTWQAASEALASAPPPFSFLLAGAATAAGIGQAAQAASVPPPAYTGEWDTGQGGLRDTHPREMILDRATADRVRDAARNDAPAAAVGTLILDGRRVGGTEARQLRSGGRLSGELTGRVGRLGHRS